MSDTLRREYPVEHGDYIRAGESSADIKRCLRQMGVASNTLRRVSVASYEAELNLVIHSLGGKMVMEADSDYITLCTEDKGPGIPDLALAMKEGYSTADDEARSLGFGAGMGLPNMKRNADDFDIESCVGQGTQIRMRFKLQ